MHTPKKRAAAGQWRTLQWLRALPEPRMRAQSSLAIYSATAQYTVRLWRAVCIMLRERDPLGYLLYLLACAATTTAIFVKWLTFVDFSEMWRRRFARRKVCAAPAPSYTLVPSSPAVRAISGIHAHRIHRRRIYTDRRLVYTRADTTMRESRRREEVE